MGGSILAHGLLLAWFAGRPWQDFSEVLAPPPLSATLRAAQASVPALPVPALPDALSQEQIPSVPVRRELPAPVSSPAVAPAPVLASVIPPRPLQEINIPQPPGLPILGRHSGVFTVFVNELGAVEQMVADGPTLPITMRETAIRAFMEARFSPGRVDGKPVRAILRVEVVFEYRLHDGSPVLEIEQREVN